MAMNPVGIGIVNKRHCQRGPNVRRISGQRTENLEGHEFDRNDSSDRYLQKFGSSVLSTVNHQSNDHR